MLLLVFYSSITGIRSCNYNIWFTQNNSCFTYQLTQFFLTRTGNYAVLPSSYKWVCFTKVIWTVINFVCMKGLIVPGKLSLKYSRGEWSENDSTRFDVAVAVYVFVLLLLCNFKITFRHIHRAVIRINHVPFSRFVV